MKMQEAEKRMIYHVEKKKWWIVSPRGACFINVSMNNISVERISWFGWLWNDKSSSAISGIRRKNCDKFLRDSWMSYTYSLYVWFLKEMLEGIPPGTTLGRTHITQPSQTKRHLPSIKATSFLLMTSAFRQFLQINFSSRLVYISAT